MKIEIIIPTIYTMGNVSFPKESQIHIRENTDARLFMPAHWRIIKENEK